MIMTVNKPRCTCLRRAMQTIALDGYPRTSFGAPPNRPSSEGTFPSAREKQSYFTRQKQSYFTLWIAAEIIRAEAPCRVAWVRCEVSGGRGDPFLRMGEPGRGRHSTQWGRKPARQPPGAELGEEEKS